MYFVCGSRGVELTRGLGRSTLVLLTILRTARIANSLAVPATEHCCTCTTHNSCRAAIELLALHTAGPGTFAILRAPVTTQGLVVALPWGC